MKSLTLLFLVLAAVVLTVSGNRRGPGRQGPVKVRGGHCEKKYEKLWRRYQRCGRLGYKGTLGCPYAEDRATEMRNFLERTCDKLDVWMGGCGYTCAVDGNWGEFSAWSECTATCGGGSMTRKRSCDSPAPDNGGNDCEGDDEETAVCNEDPCPVDGKWSEWENGECSATCGGGTMTITRYCNNPAPEYGGKDCEGEAEELALCNEDPCPEIQPPAVVFPEKPGPVESGWSEWTPFENSYCYLDDHDNCKIDKFRNCPDNAVCEGEEVEKSFDCPTDAPECEIPTGPVDGGWSEWRAAARKCHRNAHNECKMTYKRKCNNPKRRNGGKKCDGDATVERDCPADKKCKNYGPFAGFVKRDAICEDVPVKKKCLQVYECKDNYKCATGSIKYKTCHKNKSKRKDYCPNYFKKHKV